MGSEQRPDPSAPEHSPEAGEGGGERTSRNDSAAGRRRRGGPPGDAVARARTGDGVDPGWACPGWASPRWEPGDPLLPLVCEKELAAADGDDCLRTFCSSLPFLMGIVELGEDDILHVYDNPATAAFFDDEFGTTAGRWASELGAPAEAIKAWTARYRESVALGRPVRFEYLHPTSTGPRWLAATVSCLGVARSGRLQCCYVAEDMTERWRREEALRRLVECSRLSGHAFFQSLVQNVAEVLGTRYAFVADVPPDQLARAKTVAVWFDGRGGEEFEYLLDGTPCQDVVRQGPCFHRRGVRELFPDDRLLVDMGVDSYLGAPLRASDGTTVGLLVALHDEPFGEAQQLEPILDLFAGRAAAEIERLRAETALRKQNERLRFLSETAGYLLGVSDRRGVLDELFDQVAAKLGLEAYCGYVSDPDGDALMFDRAQEVSAEALVGHERIESDASGPCEAVARTRQPLVLTDLVRSQEPLHVLARDKGVRCYAGFPLLAGERLLGTLAFASRTRDRFEPGEVEFLQAIARHVAITSERQRVEHERQRLLALEQAARAEAESARRRYQDLVDGLDAIVWEADAQTWQFTFVNQRAERILGYPTERWLAEPTFWLEIIHPDDRGATVELCKTATAAGRDHDFEYRALAADGRTVWLRDIVYVVKDASGRPSHLRGVMIDVTQTKQLEAALQQRAEELYEADRRKDEFLATLAHELRNPLAPLRNALEIMRLAGGAGPTPQRIHEMMERQVHHLVRLVDDLLEVSRITRGKIELRKEGVELAAIIDAAVDTSRPLIEAAGHELVIEVPEESLHLEGDPVRLSQVLANLLNNAAKYTDRGGHIHVGVERLGSEVAITVRDDGIGMQPEMISHIFDMFTQIGRTTDRAQGGLGIGLTLVRSLVQLHGGTVHAASPGFGQGSVFTVRLPLITDGELSAARRGADARLEPAHAERILVVDDNHDSADSLASLLELMGGEARVAYDGASAMAELESFRPAAILLDLGMPGMDGFEVARRVRASAAGQDVMLIALTGWGQEEDRRRTRLAGFDHHLIKPVDTEVLAGLPAMVRARRLG